MNPPSRNHGLQNSSLSGMNRIVVAALSVSKLVKAVPLPFLQADSPNVGRPDPSQLSKSQFYIYLLASMCLVLLGGVFAGLTLGLMGQDEVYLNVIANSGSRSERHYANQVLKLIKRGKHWVLVTLLLSNVITNETLPVVLDRCLGGGLIAVFSSTVSIVIFGEIIPQSVCVRYGLQIGAYFSPFVLCLMYITYPVGYPIALLLDHILGEDHGTFYKKKGLKTLVTLHKTMGVDRLNQDEVTIISAVLDLKEKSVATIMTPLDKVFTISADTILDESTVEEIFNAGFSRIPIHIPGEPTNFIGMLLVRILISYDPEDALPVSSFPLATLPETSGSTSCLNILNYFQEGKSHMVVVSENPGHSTGAKGVLTLEDVIEELIGEEIVDESDVYIDVNKNIMRQDPGPLAKKHLNSYLQGLYSHHNGGSLVHSQVSSVDVGSKSQPKREKNSTPHVSGINSTMANGMKPSNLAANPLQTSNAHVTIKKQPPLDQLQGHAEQDLMKEDDVDCTTPILEAMSPPQGQSEYGAVHDSETEALVIGTQKNLARKEVQRDSRKFILPEKNRDNSLDLSDNRESLSSRTWATSSSKGVMEFSGLDSRRQSPKQCGIIESVVNVQGFHKTIIEAATSDHENNSVCSFVSDTAAETGEDGHLLGFLTKKTQKISETKEAAKGRSSSDSKSKW